MKIVPPKGLTEEEAASRLLKFGPNELPKEKRKSTWARNSHLIREPMILLLLAGAALYLIMGDLIDGILLVISVFVVIGISIYQEQKSERALSALRILSSPRALVIRDGIEKRVSAKDLVPGDLISIHEGDRVPADCIIREAVNLKIDESLLTGESMPVKKSYISTENFSNQTMEDVSDPFKVYSSTLVVSGTAFATVIRTGSHTEVGKIGRSLEKLDPEELNLSKEINQIVKLFGWAGAFVCGFIIILFGLTRNDWTQAILIGLATEMALLPEEFPVVLTIFIAMGAWRLSKNKVLVRTPNAIERLGAISIMCVDKTGTLTQNQMSIVQLHNGTSSIAIQASTKITLPEEFHELVEYGVLASNVDPFDPMEKAIRRFVEQEDWGNDHIHKDWSLIRDYPLSDKLLAMSCVWSLSRNGEHYVIASKGAPEAIIDLCHLTEPKKDEILKSVREMAKDGLRVLAVAKASFPKKELPKDHHEFAFQWIGLLGLEDPLRPEVPEAVKCCIKAGIRVVMVTGDYPETALKIAQQAGIDISAGVMTGSELDKLTDDGLANRLKKAHIFSRVVPSQKLRIVKALKNMGYVVGMTGDGINDAPSLKWANVGIAMGARGTDVAREASDIVLLDDNFASIVSGIERGRIIFKNIRKAMTYIAAVHVPIAGLALLPLLMGWPLILLPAHVVFLELIIDPACSFMFESHGEKQGVMNNPPRALNSRLFNFKDLIHSLFQGLFVFAVCGITYGIAFKLSGQDMLRARTLTFVILVLSNLGLIFANVSGGFFTELRSFFQKTINFRIAVGIISVLFVGIQLTIFNNLFKLVYLEISEILIAIGVSLAIFTLLMVWSRIWQSISTREIIHG